MPVADLSIAITLLAAAAGPAATAAKTSSQGAQPPPPVRCDLPPRAGEKTEIVVCAPREEPYRIDPDLLKAKRLARKRGRPTPSERFKDTSCTIVGPMGCGPSAGIDLLAAAATALTMINKAVKGENVGKMFITNPQPSEYEIYAKLKRERAAAEAEKAEKLKAKAAAAAATVGGVPSVPE